MRFFQPKIIYPLALAALAFGMAMDAAAYGRNSGQYDGAMSSRFVHEAVAKSSREVKAEVYKLMPKLERLYKINGDDSWVAHGRDSDNNSVVVFIWTIKGN